MKDVSNKFRSLTSPVSIRIYIAILAFVSSVVINRSIGVALKGQYSTILSYANYSQMLLNLGICFSYSTMLKKWEADVAKTKILTVIWIQTLFLVITSVAIALFVKDNMRVFFVVLLSVMIICNGQISFLAIIDNIKRRNTILFGFTLYNLLLNIFAFSLYKGNLKIILWFLISRYVLETIVLVVMNRYSVIKISYLDQATIKLIFRIGLPTALMNLLIACNYNLDIIMLNAMGAEDIEIGIYGVGYSLSNMLWIIPDAFKEMVYQKTAREENDEYIMKSIIINVGICSLIVLGFTFLGKYFLRIVYGEEFVIAYRVTITLLLGILPMISFKLIHPLYVNRGRAGIVMALLLVSVFANIISSYLLIPRHGAWGAAIASVVSYSVCGMLFMSVFVKEMKNKRRSGV